MKFNSMNEKGSVEQIREAQRAKGVATILGIGTAVPPNFILQTDYPDFYFRITQSDHMPHLKQKFKGICENSKIEKRHCLYDEEFLKQNSDIRTYGATSMDKRQAILAKEVPKLGMEAALKAIKEWGQPISQITHLIFCTTSCFGNLPSADYHLSKLIGLKSTVNRLMVFNIGCHAGGMALRMAKDIAENNAGSRVLVVCADTMLASFHAPSDTHMDVLIGQALFGDGAGAMIIGTNPNLSIERPIFELVLASQTTIPETEDEIHGAQKEMGFVYYISKEVPHLVSKNVEKCLVDAFRSIGVSGDIDWNNLFYAVHPGGPAIISKVGESLGLNNDKLETSSHVMRQYGNMWGPTVIFILDEIRKRSVNEGKRTTGEGLDWGVLLGFGPGLSLETVVLHSMYLNDKFG